MLKKDNLIKILSMVIVGIVFLSVFIIYNKSSENAHKEVVSLNEFIHEDEKQDGGDGDSGDGDSIEASLYVENDEYIKKSIFVEVKGEVLKPDVYKMEEGSIVYDLISIAGGITDKGSLDNINQAREIKNGECIVVQSIDDISNLHNGDLLNNKLNTETIGVENKKDVVSSIININTASKEELKSLNGIGDVLADSIIEYREENGEFKSVEDIKNIPRIGSKTFEKFKDKIAV
ncbi:ComEA family DNA-binding protein [Candidatus Arthromitus sp. SFB-rat-Yit]|uniref:ComEA family DNA-binding protein n=1 Tax=Candidatus Arthromitus sp. SFB-rat-Yit TaxID=1041504 RepID=UPI000227A3E9|nr:ComEA family DNA-binding protein [Candidatus Arthromitus sp. SFB-rat-Yit]BAK80906.1 putative comE operon protein 1 [Candidatus Arthromitus sp. SFB-rat-Yit]